VNLCSFSIYICYLEGRYEYEFQNISIHYRCVVLVDLI